LSNIVCFYKFLPKQEKTFLKMRKARFVWRTNNKESPGREICKTSAFAKCQPPAEFSPFMTGTPLQEEHAGRKRAIDSKKGTRRMH
jgi:hypothetical protein